MSTPWKLRASVQLFPSLHHFKIFFAYKLRSIRILLHLQCQHNHRSVTHHFILFILAASTPPELDLANCICNSVFVRKLDWGLLLHPIIRMKWNQKQGPSAPQLDMNTVHHLLQLDSNVSLSCIQLPTPPIPSQQACRLSQFDM